MIMQYRFLVMLVIGCVACVWRKKQMEAIEREEAETEMRTRGRNQAPRSVWGESENSYRETMK